MTKKKIFILSNARWGKDTVAGLLADEYSFVSSSYFCAQRVIFPALKEKYGYISVEECFNDRAYHREEWFKLIADYNKDNLSRLAEEIFEHHDIYVGLRNANELNHFKANHDMSNYIIVWIDASKRLLPEPKSSITVSEADANFVIDNNGRLEDLPIKVEAFKRLLTIIN